jgi:hypothetical protein
MRRKNDDRKICKNKVRTRWVSLCLPLFMPRCSRGSRHRRATTDSQAPRPARKNKVGVPLFRSKTSSKDASSKRRNPYFPVPERKSPPTPPPLKAVRPGDRRFRVSCSTEPVHATCQSCVPRCSRGSRHRRATTDSQAPRPARKNKVGVPLFRGGCPFVSSAPLPGSRPSHA